MWITALYEWTLAINTTAVIHFWFIELFFLGRTAPVLFKSYSWWDWVCVYVKYTFPMIMLIFEWWHSSIPVEFRLYRTLSYVAVFTGFFLVLFIVEMWSGLSIPYVSLNFPSSQLNSWMVVLGLYPIFVLSLFVWSIITNKRLGLNVK
jgi:hypothetical protein